MVRAHDDDSPTPSGTRYFAMNSRQKLSVLGIFWLAGVLAGVMSLALFEFGATWIWSDMVPRHAHWPSAWESELVGWSQAGIGALTTTALFLLAGIVSSQLGFLSGVRLVGTFRVIAGALLFALHPSFILGVSYIFEHSGNSRDTFSEDRVWIAFIAAFSFLVILALPRFLFLGYGIRIATTGIPRMQWKVILLGVLGYAILASAFMGVLYALVLTTSGYLHDQWGRTGFTGRLAVLDGPGLSFILWYWLVYPEGFTREGNVA